MASHDGGPSVGAEELSTALWQQRVQLEVLSFRLETQVLHLGSGSTVRLRLTASDIDAAVERVSLEHLACHLESAAVAFSWGAPPDAPLRTLAAVAPPGIWPDLLQEHLAEMQALYTGILAGITANETALAALLAAEKPLLDGPPSPEESPDAAVAAMLERRDIDAAREAAQGARLPLVAEFLGLHSEP